MDRAPLTPRPRPSRGDKLARLLWRICALVLFRWTPTPLHGWRRGVLRLFGAQVGAGVVIYPSVRIWAPWTLHLADGATIGWECELYSVAPIRVGKGAIVSQKAHLCTATHDVQDAFQLMTAPIEISANAWVAAEAFIGPGVTLGEGAVVAARGVVTRSIAARCIVAGNPAQPIGTRDPAARTALHA